MYVIHICFVFTLQGCCHYFYPEIELNFQKKEKIFRIEFYVCYYLEIKFWIKINKLLYCINVTMTAIRDI